MQASFCLIPSIYYMLNSYIHVEQINHWMLRTHLFILFCLFKNGLRAVREGHCEAERIPRAALHRKAGLVPSVSSLLWCAGLAFGSRALLGPWRG